MTNHVHLLVSADPTEGAGVLTRGHPQNRHRGRSGPKAQAAVVKLEAPFQRHLADRDRVFLASSCRPRRPTLTKRMAEDLTEFLSEHGVKVRYLHSGIGISNAIGNGQQEPAGVQGGSSSRPV